jgi:hypothetical protein
MRHRSSTTRLFPREAGTNGSVPDRLPPGNAVNRAKPGRLPGPLHLWYNNIIYLYLYLPSHFCSFSSFFKDVTLVVVSVQSSSCLGE